MRTWSAVMRGSPSPSTRSAPPTIGNVGPMPPPSQGWLASMPASISAMRTGLRATPTRRGATASVLSGRVAAATCAGARKPTGTTSRTSARCASASTFPAGTRTEMVFATTRVRNVTVASRSASTSARASCSAVTACAAAGRSSGACAATGASLSTRMTDAVSPGRGRAGARYASSVSRHPAAASSNDPRTAAGSGDVPTAGRAPSPVRPRTTTRAGRRPLRARPRGDGGVSCGDAAGRGRGEGVEAQVVRPWQDG